jgi:hypothetical protein
MGVPDQILTDNGKVFTGRFGPGKEEVLFDRICRESGVRYLSTAPRSPTTTGKVERFQPTIKKELLSDRRFESLEEAQRVIDQWMVQYNTERAHQGIGMVPPVRRFEIADPVPFEVVVNEDSPLTPDSGELEVAEPRRVTIHGQDGLLGEWGAPCLQPQPARSPRSSTRPLLTRRSDRCCLHERAADARWRPAGIRPRPAVR